jgi:uncharacterized membrane protein YqjE
MPEAAGPAGSHAGGLLDSLKTLVRTLLALGQTHLEILGSDIEEQLALLLRELLLALVAVFCLGLGIVFTALFLAVLYWDTHRLLVLGLFAAVFLGASFVGFAALRAANRARPRAFAATIQELGKDRESLR